MSRGTCGPRARARAGGGLSRTAMTFRIISGDGLPPAPRATAREDSSRISGRCEAEWNGRHATLRGVRVCAVRLRRGRAGRPRAIFHRSPRRRDGTLVYLYEYVARLRLSVHVVQTQTMALCVLPTAERAGAARTTKTRTPQQRGRGPAGAHGPTPGKGGGGAAGAGGGAGIQNGGEHKR